MFGSLARKFFGTSNDRVLRGMHGLVERVNALEPEIAGLDDAALTAQTEKFRVRLAGGADLEDILPEAFATVREASKRVLGMRHFDVQLLGGMALHRGMISEMKTGEGKTLVSTLPCYLNAISGKGVHVVTVNDYLASRDAEWMGRLYRFLGMSVGVIKHGLDDEQRQAAYACDITYATNNELGFDYLRDNMKFYLESRVQRPFNYAIVDEVDSILIDEARTPLIISGPTEDNSALYVQVDKLIPKLQAGDFDIEEKSRSVTLTEEGQERIEQLLRKAGLIEEGTELYDIGNVSIVHHVNQALKAHHMFRRDVDYIVKEGKVVIIDEFTGRMMEGRRYSEGLHQALEAKEKVTIQNENQTLASITFQNYFRLYPKLAGMTGTAMTEAAEFEDIYGLKSVEVPTHRPIARDDIDDEIYRTADEKYAAIIDQIAECHARRQPVLVGTVSIEKSEMLSKQLTKKKIRHEVLNARHHEREAHIIAQAGRAGGVTIATNMAGRGTDIMLGGNAEFRIADEVSPSLEGVKRQAAEEKIRAEVETEKQQVLEAGGLFVLGTERHESRRIDNQLRGRSGRQGDPGASKFFLSLEDDLMRIFGSDRLDSMLQKLGMQEGEAIHHPWISRALERAQKKVEARNYDIRKNLLKFDNVMNDQRKVIYEQRLELMRATDLSEEVADMRHETIEDMVHLCIPPKSYPEQWDTESLGKEVFRIFGRNLPVTEWANEEGIAEPEIIERITKHADELMQSKEELYGEQVMRMVEKRIILQTLDQLWKDHLLSLDHLRQGINLRAYGQRDPLNEYKQEAFFLFDGMLNRLREEVTARLARLHVHVESPEEIAMQRLQTQHMQESRVDPALAGLPQQDMAESAIVTPIRRNIAEEDRDPANPASWGKVNRNEPCPCGSGKKYKHCHGMI